MARPLRIEYDGALYHITSRGNERNPIYRGEEDYGRFLEILSELPRRYGIIIHGYVLIGNHYHLLIETPGETSQKRCTTSIQPIQDTSTRNTEGLDISFKADTKGF